MVKQAITDMSAKTVRMSVVALTAAVLAVAWAIIDEIINFPMSPVIVSSVTSLAMLVAQFMDYKAIAGGAEVFDGDSD